ncbi:hypothetical protein CIT292_06509 [Citrobacter youngae ATCC 29220]|uniref:Uncharacterized protein n=1 Tax=Citrobacter youngae ATCC 29220 TaxID=500640 RepID=D4B8G7_9ENTR|nr:hypothetical protein CIT292_06509 [Citrobacter youngae ATCC 29220]
MVIPHYGENRRVSKKLPHFLLILSDNNCRFLSKYLSGTKPGLFFE